MHDNTLTDDNRDKFTQIADRYGQQLKFYNVEELCADKFAKVEKYFPKAKESHFSIAMFYRLFIPHLLLPQGIEKVIYLDSDIIVNLDIEEFWQIELGDKPFGAITRSSQFKDEETAKTAKVIPLVREGVVKAEDYFHSGLLLMNLKVMSKEEDTILAGMKFVGKNPQFIYPDQDVLNYCFSTSFLKLPVKFNRVISFARSEDEWTIEKKIYHYAANRIYLGMDLSDPYNRLFIDYFIKTPWFDADMAVALSGTSFPSRKNYAVSVVIPLYNEEEYITECLDSLLAQTFQNFEVIVVDDCSTDNSVEVVKSYKPKFNGRLRLEKTEKNSGGGGYVPRNIGLMLARGEYIQFLDADDVLLGTALEILYTAAILHNAEVVYTSSIYYWNAPDDIYLYKDYFSKKMGNTKRDLTVDDSGKNLSRLLLEPGEGNFRGSWTKFVQRDFLIKNKIFFSNLSNAGDFIWVIHVYCYARRFLRISTPVYFYRRYNNHSILRTAREPKEHCWYWFSTFVDFAKTLYELEKKNEILSENPNYCLAALELQFKWCLYRTQDARKEINSKEIYKILHEEFARTSNYSILILSFLFSFISNDKEIQNSQAELIKSYAKPINKFKSFITARIDIKLMTPTGDFQIGSISDDKLNLSKPAWFQRGGIGYQLQTHAGELNFTAKATVDGQIKLWLRGIYVPDQNDKTKLIPYWIDYTKLTVNEETIFDTLTPAWCNEPFEITIDAKADEEIKIHIEWQPHRSDNVDVTSLTPKVVTPPLVKVESSIPDSFKPFITARIDTKLLSTTGDFQIVSVSDDKAKLKKPSWFQKDGVSYQLESYAGKLNFTVKATVDGQISLLLRGIDIRDPENHSKRIPRWIDYTKLTVNEKTIFDTLTPACHDKSYTHKINAKAGEETKVQVEWLPHSADTIEVKAETPPPVKVESSIPDSFEPFITARIDAKLLSTAGDFEILSVSDKRARVQKPGWLQKKGIGYQINSYAGELDFTARATVDGQIQLKLRGRDIREPEDKTKRIPYWIDYTKLTINDEKIFDTLTPAWHDKPYNYSTRVKANDEITVKVEWLPHRSDT